MFVMRWRYRDSREIVTAVPRYKTREAAENAVREWRRLSPQARIWAADERRIRLTPLPPDRAGSEQGDDPGNTRAAGEACQLGRKGAL